MVCNRIFTGGLKWILQYDDIAKQPIAVAGCFVIAHLGRKVMGFVNSMGGAIGGKTVVR